MNISSHCVVGLTWTLKDSLGDTLDILDEPVEFMVGGHDLLAVIDQALQGHSLGARVDLNIEPEDGFGDYDEQRVFLESRARFPKELEEGMTFEGNAMPAGCSPDIPLQGLYTVTEIYPEHVVLDGNHPLAGIGLRLSVKVESVREATEEETARGSTGSGFFQIPTAD
jgi:FKBP-type peptidyl-prolyl cis-trans isomerase SlyD